MSCIPRPFVCVLLVLFSQQFHPRSVVSAERSKHVLAIGIDGLRTDALDAAKTPNIDALKKNGSYSNTCKILGSRYQKNDTISGPGWTSYLTGVWADKHGVHDNEFGGQRITRYPHFFHLIKQQYPDYKTASLIDWYPIDKYIVSKADVRVGFEAHGSDGYTVFDQHIADRAVKVLAEQNVRATMVYFGSTDETGHRYGFHPAIPQYMRCIEKVDQHVGRLVEAIKSRPTYQHEDWMILISSDHGGEGKGHGSGHQVPTIHNIYLIVSGDSAEKGEFQGQVYLVDLVATALKHLKVELRPEWQLDGKPVGLLPRPQ
jgi:arylsulfatase A-like enzyme